MVHYYNTTNVSDGKFVSRNEIVTTTGTLTFNGGTF